MGYIDTFDFDGEYVTWTTDGIYAGTCFYRNGQFNCTNVCGTLKIIDDKIILYKYLSSILNEITPNYVVKVANPKLMNNVMADIKIPLPPLEIQQQIVAEVMSVDNQIQTLNNEIEELQQQSQQVLSSAFKNISGYIALNNTNEFELSIGKRVISKEMNDNYSIPVYSANVFEPFGFIDKLLITDFSQASVLWGIDGDWQVNTIDANIPFYPTDHCGVLRVKNGIIHEKLLAYALNLEGVKNEFSRAKRASLDRISDIKIPLPQGNQQKIIAEFERLQQTIQQNEQQIATLKNEYNRILDKYLK